MLSNTEKIVPRPKTSPNKNPEPGHSSREISSPRPQCGYCRLGQEAGQEQLQHKGEGGQSPAGKGLTPP